MLTQKRFRSCWFFFSSHYSPEGWILIFCFMQSVWALQAVFLYAVKLKRAIFTLKLYFLEFLFLGLMRHGIWKWKQLSPCISLCLQAEKSQVYKWENWHKLHGANADSLSSSEDFSKYCWLVVLFPRKHWCIPHGIPFTFAIQASVLQNAHRQLSFAPLLLTPLS